ncbi:MAG: alpha/beta hydrolase [Geodermatophilaceae bacterium]|nr:alpha/beta hydrolase [Geodermatophilaceae bacterium]
MVSRRGVLRGGAAAVLGAAAAGCLSQTDRAPAARPVRHDYGQDPSQYAELTLPAGEGPFPVVVVVHGGFWRSAYDLSLGRPLAEDLAGRGYAVWNLEYRRVGNGGGWPATFTDVAAGIDLLAGLDAPLDLDTVLGLGHSAGGHLAVWAAARPGLPPDAPGAAPVVALTAVLSQAGVLDLRRAAEEQLGAGATQEFLGGAPADQPERYTVASPVQRVPLGVPVVCVHGRADTNVPLSQSRSYVEAATAAGDLAELIEVDGDHFVVIEVGSPAWREIVDQLRRLR